MKLNSISGITYKVKDLQESVQFYEKLGFRIDKQDETHAICYVNWFWVDLVADSSIKTDGGGENVSTHIRVDNAEEYYKGVVEQGLQPASEPTKKADIREFMLTDPNGHRLVFFDKK